MLVSIKGSMMVHVHLNVRICSHITSRSLHVADLVKQAPDLSFNYRQFSNFPKREAVS